MERASTSEEQGQLTLDALVAGFTLISLAISAKGLDAAPQPPVPTPNGNQYSVAFEMELDPSAYGRSDSVHFNRANAALDGVLKLDPAFAEAMEILIPGVRDAVSGSGGRVNPPGWSWHHDVTPGTMQLVPTLQHQSGSIFQRALHPGGGGGYSRWALPAGAPRRH